MKRNRRSARWFWGHSSDHRTARDGYREFGRPDGAGDGASSGIGDAIAERLAREGVNVAISARRRDRLDALVSRIGKAGGEAVALVADVSDPDAAQDLVRQAEAKLGRLDILVNNAGVMYIEPIAAPTSAVGATCSSSTCSV